MTGISEQRAVFVHGSVQSAIASPCAAENPKDKEPS